MKKSSKVKLAVIVAAAVLAAGAFVYWNKTKSSDSPAESKTDRQGVPVVLTQAREMTFEERLVISGNVEAKNTAFVSARIPGVLDEIFVDEGDHVETGQKLFQTDKINLEHAVEAADKQVAVAAATILARKATVERIEADLAKVKIDYERYKRLYEQDHAVSKSAFEAQESQYKQVQAMLKEAEAALSLAKSQEQQASSRLEIARKDLSDSLVFAPIGGMISERILEPGEMSGAGTQVLRIDALDLVELTAYLPEAYYSRVKTGSTVMRALVQGTDIGEVLITTKAPTIHPKLRTFEVKALMKNPPAGVVPGARVELTVIFQKRTGTGVPRAAIVRRGGGLAVFAVHNEKAKMIAIKTGLEISGWVELVDDSQVAKGMPIVSMGQNNLNDGTAVVEVKEDAE